MLKCIKRNWRGNKEDLDGTELLSKKKELLN